MPRRPPSANSIHRRFMRYINRNTRIFRAAQKTPRDSPERARWRRWKPVADRLDARLWPLMVASGQGSTLL